MANIRLIQPSTTMIKPIKRVAAYARVSMETEQLIHSLSEQISHFNQLIQSNADWELAGIYADEGITGTKTVPRKEFNRMLSDCDAGKIDIIYAKSISRFARNTVDCLQTVRHLREIGVEVRFEREGISTLSSDGELLLTLLASFAQAESESIAANVRWAVRKKFEEGIPNGHKAPYGYRWDGEMFRVIPEQGEIVRYIYDSYLAGGTGSGIARTLREKGVKGQSGKPMCDSTIRDIISNISYTGTMLLQKTFFSEGHARRRNNGELPMYAVEEMFEPLVTVEEYTKALTIRKERADAQNERKIELTRFSGIIKCGCCGRSVSRRTQRGKKKWVCNTRERKGSKICDMRPIDEAELMNLAETVAGRISDEEFRRQIVCVIIFGDRVEFDFQKGKKRAAPRVYTGERGSNPFTNKIYCADCGCKCERDTDTRGLGIKTWRCSSCGGQGVKETGLVTASKRFFGNSFGGQIVERVSRIEITEALATFILKDGRVKTWQNG